jgi:hypothetical protein
MKVTIWKNDKESNERAITRFNKRVQASRKLLLIRKKRYHASDPTRRFERCSAIIRSRYRAVREKTRFY